MPAPSPQDVQSATRRFYDALLTADLAERVRAASDPARAPAWEQYVHEGRRQQEVERTRRDLACGRIAQVEEEARRLIDGSGWDIQPGTAAYHELCFTLLRALLKATMRQAERDQAIYFGRPSDPLRAGACHGRGGLGARMRAAASTKAGRRDHATRPRLRGDGPRRLIHGPKPGSRD